MNEKLQQFENKMSKAYEYLAADFATIRAGRANPHILDKIKVNYYGLSLIHISEPTRL